MLLRAALASAVLASACASPVGVERVSPARVHEDLTRNVLSVGEPSPETLAVLTALGARGLWADDREAALRSLHGELAGEGQEDLVFALAELSFAHAQREERREWFLAAAVYAWAFLFPGDAGAAPHAADRRTRLAFDLYNRGLIEGVPGGAIEEIPAQRTLVLPFGSIAVETDLADFSWAGRPLHDLVPTADFEVRGLENRYRFSGIGASMSGAIRPPEELPLRPADRWVPPNQRVPLTLVLFLEDARRALPAGSLRGRLDAFYWVDERAVEIEGRSVPLELELSSALAHALDGAAIWDYEYKGFFSGAFQADDRPPGRLAMLHPWFPAQIPVVLVHGTASSPGRWADFVNELLNDPELGRRFQPWFFLYNTGNPILYSAGLLREALSEAVHTLDPDGEDATLRDMVVIGHSQGGLLTRLQVTDPGTRFWDRIFDVPPEEIELDDEAREILERSLLFAPQPAVGRVVYVSTPHQGSYLAAFRLANLLSGLVRLPGSLAKLGVDVLTLDAGASQLRRLGRLPTSIDNMAPGSQMIEVLQELPPLASVPSHSIIPVKGGPPPEDQSDGVVRYDSAHLPGVVSEKVVFGASHSVQARPQAILEIKRILREHLAAFDAREAP